MDICSLEPPQAAQPDTRLRYLRPLTLPAAPPAAPARDFPMRRPGERTQGRQALGWAPRSGRSRGERDVGLRGARAIRQREPRGGPRGGGVLSGHRPLGSVRVPWRLRGREHARAGGRGAAREHVRVVVQLAVRLRRQRLLQLRRMMRRQGQLRGLRRLGLRLRLRLRRRQLRAHRAGAAPLRAAQAARVAQRQAAAPLWRLSRAWVRKTGRRCGRRSGCLTRAPEAEARAHGARRWGPTAGCRRRLAPGRGTSSVLSRRKRRTAGCQSPPSPARRVRPPGA